MSQQLNTMRLPELQKYLRARGVTVSGYNKAALKEIAVAVERLNLPVDPDYQNDSVFVDIKKKLKKAGLPDSNPLQLDGYTSDFTYIPEFGLIDIFNYLIFNKTGYDAKKLKGYKSFEDYKLFYDGHVESLLFNTVSEESGVCLFKASVKPTQRDKTYLQKDTYDLWFALDKEDGYVISGHCECIGGADGACRHLAAALYELEAFDLKSCTDGENQWMKRPRHHDIPVPIRHLTVVKAKYATMPNQSIKPHSDLYDPRPEQLRYTITDDKKREFGLKLQEIAENAQALDLLLNPEDKHKPANEISEDLESLSILNKAKHFVDNNDITDSNTKEKTDEFLDSLSYSSLEISKVLEKTEGQANNKLWLSLRQGLLTASNFAEACNCVDKNRQPSASFMKKIMGETHIDESMLPPPLKWGRKKEETARVFYERVNRKKHVHFRLKETGVLISEQHNVLGCSVDGITSCKCKPPHQNKLIEIKCPYSMRNLKPKAVAIEKKCVYNKATNRWEVEKDCPYYAQIQGQLGLYGYSECDLVIYTKLGIHVSTVEFNAEYYSEMVNKLCKFHQTYVIPHILRKFCDM